ncbi:hypothetical protein SLS56_000755 [Neofusicoccum ribis]|uniref:C2H2-type domain-containing protein n=1 Tax=Neofusicoccum ribis TaxID=45134 RepID=A0ABR3TC33_9PEZI
MSTIRGGWRGFKVRALRTDAHTAHIVDFDSLDRCRPQPHDLKPSHAPGNPIRAISDKIEADSTYGTDPNRPDSVTEDTRGSTAYSIIGSIESPRLTEESLDSSQLFELRSMPPLDEQDCDMDEEFPDDADVLENTPQDDGPPAQLTEYELVRQLILSGEQEVMRMVMDAYRDMVGQHGAFQDDLPLTEDSFTELGSEYSSERDPSDAGEGQVERSSRGTPNARQSQRPSQAANPKRGRNPYDPNEEDGEGDSKRHKSTAVSGPAERNGRRFACHYSKKYRGDSRLRRSCIHGGFDTVHRVKEHIFRTHILPTQCSECFQTFDNDRGLTAHHVRGECPRTGTQTELGVARGEQEAMALRRRQERQTSEEEKWNAVWRILFREDEEIPDPYYEPPFNRSNSPDFESITNYERAVQTQLPRRVQDRITAQWPNIAEALIRQLPSIIRSEQASIASNYPGVRNFFVDRPEDTEAATLDVPVNTERSLVGASPYGNPNMLPRAPPSDAATSDPEAGLRSAPETEQSSVASAGMEAGYYHSPQVNASQSMIPQICPLERLGSSQDPQFLPRGLPHRMPATNNRRNNMQFRQPTPMGNMNANLEPTLPNYDFMPSPENAVIGASPAAFPAGPYLNPTQFDGMTNEAMGPPAYPVPDFSPLGFSGWSDPLLETMAQANNNSPSDFSGAGTSPHQQQ